MKHYNVGRYIFLSIIGLAIFGVGLTLIKTFPDLDGALKVLPYLCIGIGAGVFGGNLGTAIRNKSIQNNPKAAKQVKIEESDERNQAISAKAKAKAFDLMLYGYAAILLAFALMLVDLYVILILVAIYLIFVFTYVFYLSKYQKEM